MKSDARFTWRQLSLRDVYNFMTSSIVPVTFLLVWEFAVWTGWWPRTLIASPFDVALDFIHLFGNGMLIHHTLVSLSRLTIGFLLGAGTAVLFGSVVGLFRLAERLVSPTIQILAPIPAIAWIPLLIILFSIDGARIALIAVGTFGPVFFSVVHSIRSVNPHLVEVAYIYNKTRWEILWKILLPAALPSIFGAFRVALGLSWILLLAAEVIASSSGLGWLIWDSRNFSRPDDMIVGMIAVGILGALTDRSIAILQSRVLRWRSAFQGQ